MSPALIVKTCGPGTTVQDLGRFGMIASGASPAGAADADAMYEGAALLGQDPNAAALELAGLGGTFDVTHPTRIALTGAPAPVRAGEAPLAWNASHLLRPGETLTIGASRTGNYSYLHLGGGIDTPLFLGSRATHLVAQIGAPVTPGSLALGADKGTETDRMLPAPERFGGGTIRIIASAQTAMFRAEDIDRLQATTFARDPRGNRMGARMGFDGPPFAIEGGLSILSEMVVPGDIQVTGDGTPFVLLNECQTTGGYPRIGSVIPPDIPRIAQARAGAPIRFALISRESALALHAAHQVHLRALTPRPRRRDPHDIPDLLSYQLISGAITGDERE
ncbi:MAG: urea amidolyase [Pseudomonadota bacterium]